MATAEIHLKTGDSPFTADPAQSLTLPARFYTDESVYALEQEAIFYNSWWYAGHVSQLQKTGDYLTTEIHEQSVFVVRDRDGDLRAFYNVCQHRGHELVNGSGHANLIV